MTKTGEAVAQAARALVGVRFRPQGRDPLYGLDCVGLAAAALKGAGCGLNVPHDYPGRGGDPLKIVQQIDGVGLMRIDPAAVGEGDVLLMEAGPAQYHLAVRTRRGFIHADAGLRRVVETPGNPGWPVIGAWRAGEGQG